jgi:hypothetical protein
MISKSTIIPFLFVLALFTQLSAQEGEVNLISARPGLSSFPSRLDQGSFVLEAGFSMEREYNESDFDENRKVPIEFRYGLLENMEVNIAFTYRSFEVNEEPLDRLYRGLDATVIGAKFRIAEERGIYPRIEFSGNLKLPYFGEETFIPEDVEPRFNLSFLHNVNDKFRFTYGFGMFWRGPDENGFYGLKVTRFMGTKHGFFVEHYAYLRGNEKNEAHIGAGYILLANRKIQLDVGLDLGGMKDRTFLGGNLGFSVLLKD